MVQGHTNKEVAKLGSECMWFYVSLLLRILTGPEGMLSEMQTLNVM